MQQSEVISVEEEDQLWKKGVMGTSTPTGLQNAAFFVVGKMFCLRGGQEHKGLQLSQLKRYEDRYVYYENTSKNRNGSFKQLSVKNKVVPFYPSPESGERCPVKIHTSVNCLWKQNKKIYSTFDHSKSLPMIPTSHGTVQFL